jgi:hypothetical protein
MPRGVDAEMLLAGYYLALHDQPIEALETVVKHLVRGTWHEEVKFCPRPPELANMVRSEQRRVEATNRPRLPFPASVPHQFRDLRIVHRQRAEDLARQRYLLVANGITHESFGKLAKSRGIPAGSIHLWAIDEIWAPAAVAHLVDTNMVETRKRSDVQATEFMSEEQSEYWAKIDALKDAPQVTAEQLAFRRRIKADLDEVKPDDSGKTAA